MVRKKYWKYVIGIIALTAIFLVSVMMTGMRSNKIITNVHEMVKYAEELEAKGDYENACYQLLLYCQENTDDSDAWMLLGDFYLKYYGSKSAIPYYQRAAKLIPCSEMQVGESDKVKSYDNFSSVEYIKIYPSAKLTKDMTLTFMYENLTPDEIFTGRMHGNSEKTDGDENYLTTDWFAIDDEKEYVYITGNINCAEWQFVDSNGYFTRYSDSNKFKTANSVGFEDKSYSVAEIPKHAVKARVTYYNKAIDTNISFDDEIFIGYGNTLNGYTEYAHQSFQIPDMKEGQYVEYREGHWFFYDGIKIESLDWEKVIASNTVMIVTDGELCGMADIEIKEKKTDAVDKTLEYGIRYHTESAVAVCERLGAASGMNFDYMVEEKWQFGTGNDFDFAYPWCEMQLCNISYDENETIKITLENEVGFKTDGSNGNVMVRIPKFYSKRVVQDNGEYIWISGTEYEGYKIEPVFINDDGSIADYVYISAYLGAEKDQKIISAAGTYPTICLDYGTTLRYAENNGDGFKEMNYLMCAALQKLFIVETGTIDSSSVFAGDTYMYYNYSTENYADSGYVAESADNTNVIRIYYNYNTVKITQGSSIAIFDGWKNYKNGNGTQREVLCIEKNGAFMEITFDGAPMTVTKHATMVSNIPSKTGKTNGIEYCTGTLAGMDGKVSFKYRNIENLYGSSLIMLDDDAYVQDGYFYYYSGGILNQLSEAVAEQRINLDTYEHANIVMCIRKMIYDSEHAQIMLPLQTGEGASAYGYYGDIWMYTNAADGTKSYFLYGGADDNERLAGVFQMRAVLNSYSDWLSFYSARIMYM